MIVRTTLRHLLVVFLVLHTQVLLADESPKAEEVPKFDILEFRVSGNSVLPNSKIEETVYPFMGEGKDINVVEQARTALENFYHENGYPTVFVNIPEQQVNGGLVRLEVVEGRIERLRIKDAHYYSLGVIKSRVPELEEGKVPHFPTVQEQLGIVNRNEDRQVTPVLRAGKTPGKVEVDLKVQDHLPLHGNLELNDRYSANTTRTRLSGTIKYDNLWQQDHSIGISFQLTPENTDQTKVLSATYVIPRLNGDYLALYGVLSKSNISAVGDINVLGNGNIYGIRYIKPLPMLSGFFHTLTVGADYKDFKENTVLLGADSNINTPISYLPFYLGYDATLQGASYQTQVALSSTFSVRGLGNDESEFLNKRYLARADFMTFKAEIKHTQQLPANWVLFGRLSAGLSSGPLISNEQFAVGGVDSVRGYLESNSLGDGGSFGNIELRSPSIAKMLPDAVKELYGLAFYDQGHVSIRNPLPSQIESYNLASAGLGLRLKTNNGVTTSLDFAEALRTAGTVKDGDARLHFRINYDW
ncbi:MAG: BamA/TamA family outer membrane protein [Burkholderiaceae bacterium]|nr:BamA/TamA family outer membrane protein [Burkholderiaceae bacterium]